MLIKWAKPLEGAKQHLCEGDEATVSRILTEGKYPGLVERIQPIRYGSSFGLIDSERNGHEVRSSALPYHLLRFLAGRLAKLLWPENFINLRELRVYHEPLAFGESAIYSDFVPDENGVSERIKSDRSRTKSGVSSDVVWYIRQQRRMAEARINPKLFPTYDLVCGSGLYIAVPAANYHLADGKTVFMEVEGINLHNMLKIILSCEGISVETLIHLATLYSISLISEWTNMRRQRTTFNLPTEHLNSSYPESPFSVIVRDALIILMAKIQAQTESFFSINNLTIKHHDVEALLRVVRSQRLDSYVQGKLDHFLNEEIDPIVLEKIRQSAF